MESDTTHVTVDDVTKRVRKQWAHVPLSIRLVSIITVLLVVGLTTVGFSASLLIERFLIGQIDNQLRGTANQLLDGGLQTLTGGSGESLLPSDYYVGAVIGGQHLTFWYYPATAAAHGVPDLSNALITTDSLTEPFTVSAAPAATQDTAPPGATWRAIGIPITQSWTGATGMAYIALPLAYTKANIAHVRVIFIIGTLAVSLLGGILGYIAVRQSLKPLRRIETTAAAIADGDLSARVPETPRTTEVGSLAHSLNVMLSQVEAAFSAREASENRMRQFVSDASHELRTPLATIRGYGELYRMGALDKKDDLDDTMQRIEDSSRRMASLVEDLLALARLDEGRQLRHEPVNLALLAHDGLMDLSALDATRTVTLVDLSGEELSPTAHQSLTCVVSGDEDKLRQVVMNLIGNVARHTPAGTDVEIAVGTDGDFGVLEVIDHGAGVPPEHVERLFERFYRADSSRDRRSGGSGLGLAIVAAIVGALDGEAAIRQTPGGGLTVSISLPLASAATSVKPDTH
ncbi:two-component system, OmpR family, sensor kinase [Micrococcales bacterium KH10]|nr:two-component system, OmpR family, sensor kinase [Micrococcales bacterium KH10]